MSMQGSHDQRPSSRHLIRVLPILLTAMVSLALAGWQTSTTEKTESPGGQADQVAADRAEPVQREYEVIRGKGIELHRLGEGETEGQDAWAAAVISSQEKRFTGERISIVLKDAEIKDILKTFATLTGLNIVIDPRVTGKVTLELHDVPWDQVIDLILKMNGYAYTTGDRVVIIHPIA